MMKTKKAPETEPLSDWGKIALIISKTKSKVYRKGLIVKGIGAFNI